MIDHLAKNKLFVICGSSGLPAEKPPTPKQEAHLKTPKTLYFTCCSTYKSLYNASLSLWPSGYAP